MLTPDILYCFLFGVFGVLADKYDYNIYRILWKNRHGVNPRVENGLPMIAGKRPVVRIRTGPNDSFVDFRLNIK